MNFDFESEIYEEFYKINNDYDEFYEMDLNKWQIWYGNNENEI